MPSRSVPSSSSPPPTSSGMSLDPALLTNTRQRSQSASSHSRDYHHHQQHAPSMTITEKYEFWAGNPSVHMSTGLIYVHDFDFNTKTGRSSSSSSSSSSTAAAGGGVSVDYDGFEPTVLLCPSVPKDTPPTEVVAIWESYQAGVEQYKVLHGPYPESYLLLVLVGGSDSHANARQLVGGASSSLPLLEVTGCRIDGAISKSVDDVLAPVQLFAPVLTKDHQCSICLDPLLYSPSATSTGGQASCGGGGVALTILCGHSFHWKCLSKWCDRSCPVCRFQQYPSRCSSCDVCGEADAMKLMVCLVCGFIGCCDTQGYPSLIEETFLADDRHHYTHAYAHFLESDHAFAMQVSTQSVFDFSEGGYVGLTGRASQDGCADGEGSDDSKDSCKKVKHVAKKILQGDEENIMSEFNEVYATLQESQQQHYEEIFEEIRARNRESYSNATGQRDEVLSRLCDAKDELDSVEEDKAQLRSEEEDIKASLERLRVDCSDLDDKRRQLREEVARLKKDLQRRQIASTVRTKKLHDEKADLREQINDLKQYLSMRAQVQKSGATDADVQGSFVIAQNAGNRRARRGRR
ncbi:brca1-associated protein, putative [Perkinsus marinus ATCC 50983]|uniref:Brca1-associated protein, putative n=1 Tax=Perkinsus marinus (strain ATCC 50983 / TXsc) TaxID=423536 RepID=C5LZZ2_PERM5|nr:brca1-associated protein, putative [Perkinsus marinus ATCC 50983]EEQ97810.1 brca1-associated protein, putative [Perkinsus marinus ATCC 50983]|eukprot:XP_002765093.1 brca1-associated protein, putative [Perkinsus marinus ATCC 50983]